jgi:subfamily B ATP-binding cassette protein HlyB/CyaB
MSGKSVSLDTGLAALIVLLRFHGVAAEAEQVRHQLAIGTGIGVLDMLRYAKSCGLKARQRMSSWPRLAKTPLPALASSHNGDFFIIAKVDEARALILDPIEQRSRIWSRAELEEVWDGGLVLFARRAPLSDLSRRFDLTWFLQAMHKYRRLFGEVLVASLFLQVLALISPLFFQVVIDKVLVHRALTTLDVLVLGLVTVSVFEAVLGGLRTYVFTHTTNRIDVELGARLFRHLVSLPLAYFEARRAGDSVARVRELETIRNFLTGSALTLVVDLVFAGLFLAVMFYYSPFLSTVVIAAFPIFIGLSAGLTPVFRRLLNEKFARGAENQSFLVETVTNIETLKAMAVEPQMQRRWEEQLAAYVRASFRAANLAAVGSQLVQLTSKLVTAATLYFGAKLVIAGGLTVGELIAFNLLAGRLMQPVLRLAQIWQDFHQARLSIARLGDILNTPPERPQLSSRGVLPSIRGEVSFENVSFRYRPDGQIVLREVTFHAPAGQILGIVGPSGSGKSSLAKLIQRLYICEGGRVLIDGTDIATVDVAWLRRQIGVVLQEDVLFNRSVRENIALIDPTMPMERIIAAAELAGAHDFIVDLSDGYETVVGERGTLLSGGQRQRIAIARALIHNPRILIFDEATSALDYESERIVHENMRRICTGRTVFIIAHRLSALRQADRIIALERGRLVEDGEPRELMHRGGRYAMLCRAQAGLYEVK